jgi:PAS domain S-box-containing protein
MQRRCTFPIIVILFSCILLGISPRHPALQSMHMLSEGWKEFALGIFAYTQIHKVTNHDSRFQQTVTGEYLDEWHGEQALQEGAEVFTKKYSPQRFGLVLQILEGDNILVALVGQELIVSQTQPQPARTSEARISEERTPREIIFVSTDLWGRYGWYVLATVSLIALQGMLLAMLLVEARKRKASDRSAKRRRDFERLLSEITARLGDLPPERTAIEITRGLDDLRSYFSVEQICLLSRAQGGAEFYPLYSSSADSTLPFPAIQIEKFAWSMAQLLKGQAVLIERIDRLSSEAAPERLALQKIGIRSIAVVPITTQQSVLWIFALTVSTRQRGWPENIVRQIQILGDVFYQSSLRQKAENKVLEMQQRFILAFDNSPVMIWMSGTDKLCNYFNQGWLTFTGRTMEQERGSGWLEGVHPDDQQEVLTGYFKAFDEKEKFKFEYQLRRFDGEYRWIVDCGVPRFEPDGTFCGYIGSCIDITDLKRSEQELKELSGRLIHVQEDERKRIARELHDDFSQQVTALGLMLAQLSLHSSHEPRIELQIRDLEARIKELSRAMRSRAHQLHSSHLEVLGLGSAIQGYCNEFSKQHAMAVDFKQSGVPSHVPSDVSLCLFRIVQEGMHNIAMHSHTKSCSVELTAESEGLLLRISDSGVGFDQTRPRSTTGLGLISMRERLRLVNGQIILHSAPRKGTQLEVRVPLRKFADTA